MRVRRALVLAAAALVAVALTACAGLPTSGPVNAGLAGGDEGQAPDFSFIPDRPQPGATPEQIVEGFIRAGSGPADSWGRARLFLAPAIHDTWRPNASVTVDVQSERSTAVDEDDGTVTLSIAPVANVDDTGVYSLAEPGATSDLPFKVAKQPGGEWRITAAPDGVVIDQSLFPNVYHRYPLMFFDSTWQYLVPDVRWLPATTAAARISKELVDGPSPWLARAAFSAFPENVTLDPPTVPVVSGAADVSLSADAVNLDSDTLDRMQTQLETSLASAGVTTVRMSAGGTPLTATAVQTRVTAVAASPLVLDDKSFGFLVGDELDPIPGLSAAVLKVAPAPVSIQVSAERDFAAVLREDGAVVRVGVDGDSVVLDDRPDLITPSIDQFGYTWTASRDAAGTLTAFDHSGQALEFAAPWSTASQVSAISLSRDGARIAAIVTTGGRSAAWVAGIVRDAKGVPQGVDEAFALGPSPGTGIDIAWLDAVTVGVLATSGDQTVLVEQPIGGPASTYPAPSTAASISGANQITTVRLRGSDGALYDKRGSNWQQTGTGVRVLATQQGAPQ